MPLRNFILIIGLALFLIGYISYWAYQTQYLEPRQRLNSEIERLAGETEGWRNSLAATTQFNVQNINFFYRSLPQTRNDANSQYTFWLQELLLYSGFENSFVDHGTPVGVPAGASYQFTVRCTGSLSQLSYLLFEFYYAPFLHRITSMTLRPTDGNTEQLDFYITINALMLDLRLFHATVNALSLTVPYYPSMNQLPSGWHLPRLASNDLASYQVISDRNLLQTARGGIDRADYTFLTGILVLNNQTEVWFSVRTDNSRITAKLGDMVQSGSFSGRLVEILEQDIVLEREDGSRWLLTGGESLNQAFALPPETAGRQE
jgi:hypothetical protein